MSKALRNILIALVVLVAAAALVLTGMYIGRAWWQPAGYGPGNMMSWDSSRNLDEDAYRFGRSGTGYGMMGQVAPGYGMGPGMMGQAGPGYGMMGSGMMGQTGPGYGMMGSGMFSGSAYSPLFGVGPLSVNEAEQAVEEYLAAFNEDDLGVGEVMIFDNHGYAQIIEQSTGIGAMEVLIDPVTGAVSPEFGPNMMWNLKYGHMAGSGMMGMKGGFDYSSDLDDMDSMMEQRQSADLPEEMPVSDEEAVQIAQRYIEVYLPGAQADDHAQQFYGYYTLHINRGGNTVGMLSVNGYSGQVFIHSWHGEFVEMSESH